MKAVWKQQVLAQSDATVVVEGNHYFPPDSINRAFFEASDESSFCPWKGTASYYDIVVAGERNPGAAWYYPEALEKARHINGMVAFWRGVEVLE